MEKVIKKDIFKRISKNARISLRTSSLISEHLKSEFVQPEHLLVGILLNENALATKIVASMGLEIKEIVGKVLDNIGVDITADINTSRDLKFSPSSKEVLRRAYDWSLRLSHVYVGTEHLMLSILESKDLYIKDIVNMGLTQRRFHKYLFEHATYPLGVLAKPEMSNSVPSQGKILDVIGRDLVETAKTGKLDPLVGREEELGDIIKILSRRKKNNPIVVGDAGVGKTVLIEGLAQKIADDRVPPSLRDMRIVSLDVASIMAGSRMRGDVEEKVLEIVNEVIESNNTILFIDEIHNILTSGVPGGSSEIAAILKPALLKEGFRCIGATTTDEYSAYFENDNALARRFQPIFLKEPTLEESIQILRNLRPIFEAHHNININDEAIKLAVTLSDRYISDRYLPDKAIDLLDEASATKRLSVESGYESISSLTSKLRSIQNAKKEFILQGRMERAEKYQKSEDTLLKKIDKLEKLQEKSKKEKDSEVNVEDIRRVVSNWTGIPLNTLGSKEKTALLRLDSRINRLVIGQKEAVNSVVSAIKRARIGISDVSRPWASFLFLGPTGVGKTQLAKVLASELFGHEDRLVQIDMSEMMEMHSVSKLIGSPPGYVGFQEGGWLTEKVRRNPHCVILFDEIEKAHPDVLNILLQILEYGHLTDGRGRRVNFKNTIVILTSNIGAEEISKDKVLGFSSSKDAGKSKSEQAYSTMKTELMSELRRTLRPELLNRLDDIVIFRALNSRDAKKIVELLVIELNERLKTQDKTIILSKALLSYIVKEGFSEEYGARPLRRVLQDLVESTVANYILKNEEVSEIKLDIKDGRVNILK
ncbi:ATP-dependent Clp protease ATP-binding subunit [Candidatus Dojkabacteria bacterium]|uniref:ATP-dependent Clp protease ATP-binding subunit n=1 Tax=Candidatus Dojkabacteria bacterium TaxID=2099670 RepID=A0A847ET01_9BACT|nr:ATP-dependent Clp protease ATP-binding subunit [Candidatus Dojkabacteria bacterium]